MQTLLRPSNAPQSGLLPKLSPELPAKLSPELPAEFEADIRAGRIRPGMNFHQRAWAMTARIPAGCVVTYADIAHALGSQGYRAVGHAMHCNPYAPGVPCHRVVGSDGRLTGFAHGLGRKIEMLEAEGVPVVNGRVDLTRYRGELGEGG